MKIEIENFITQLVSIKCSESIEFRQRFQKKWLWYLSCRDKNIEKDLLRLKFEYHKFTNSHS